MDPPCTDDRVDADEIDVARNDPLRFDSGSVIALSSSALYCRCPCPPRGAEAELAIAASRMSFEVPFRFELDVERGLDGGEGLDFLSKRDSELKRGRVMRSVSGRFFFCAAKMDWGT